MDIETIKALFDEDFCEVSRTRLSDDEYVNTNKKSSSAYDALVAQLDEPTQTLLESFLEFHDRALFLERRQTFIDGFSIATKLVTEALYHSISQ